MTDPGGDMDRFDQVIAALDQLAEGSFGRCEICGTQIDERRLRLTVNANRCTQHLVSPPPATP